MTRKIKCGKLNHCRINLDHLMNQEVQIQSLHNSSQPHKITIKNFKAREHRDRQIVDMTVLKKETHDNKDVKTH